jgi:hypothetical protein
MAPYRSYAMAFEIRCGALSDALYWDTLDPYHYIRVQPGDGKVDHVIVGGADHKTGEADDADIRFEAIDAWARNLIPELGDVTHRWSGQLLDTHRLRRLHRPQSRQHQHLPVYRRFRPGMTHGVVGSLINSAPSLAATPDGRKSMILPARRPRQSVTSSRRMSTR